MSAEFVKQPASTFRKCGTGFQPVSPPVKNRCHTGGCHTGGRSPVLCLAGSTLRPSAFTLTEMIVVVAIIVIILAAVLPSLSSTWAQRKAADAETTVRGAIATARMQALGNTERGLLFVVDPDSGAQKIYPIRAEPRDPATEGPLTDESTANRFVVLPGQVQTLPLPYRVAPRSLVDETSPGNWVWDDTELTNQDYNGAPQTTLELHRNFFTVIFSPDGQLSVGRDVLIHDPDAQSSGLGFGKGDRTGLDVSDDVPNWYDGTAQQPFDAKPSDMVADAAGSVAINLRSVDGLLVYNDDAFSELPTPVDKRDFLLRTAQPLYISRLSGAVVRGPRGENR